MLAGDRELKVINPRQALAAFIVAFEGDSFQRHVAVKQLEFEFGAMLFDAFERPFTQAMGVPQPGAGSRQQHEDENVAQGQHGKGTPTEGLQLNCVG